MSFGRKKIDTTRARTTPPSRGSAHRRTALNGPWRLAHPPTHPPTHLPPVHPSIQSSLPPSFLDPFPPFPSFQSSLHGARCRVSQNRAAQALIVGNISDPGFSCAKGGRQPRGVARSNPDSPPPPPCDIPSGRCSFTGPWTATRSSLRMLRQVVAFCRPVLLAACTNAVRRSGVSPPPPPTAPPPASVLGHGLRLPMPPHPHRHQSFSSTYCQWLGNRGGPERSEQKSR